MRDVKIAIIGAGSAVFCKTLLLDILAIKWDVRLEVALMAPSTAKSAQVKEFADAVIAGAGINASIYVTTDRADAVKGAKYIITTFLIGGMEAYKHDYETPLKYGVDQCIADSIGPGGIFRALRTVPVMMELADDVKRHGAPGALILNYVNPMAIVSWALNGTGVDNVGLCHGVQTTIELIASYVGLPKKDIDYFYAGINHMTWFLRLEHNGEDLYPKLRENFEKPEYYANEKVRGELFRQVGYFMTESTGHLSEYLPWFRSSDRALGMYCDEPLFGGESGAAYKWGLAVAEKQRGRKIFEGLETKLPLRSIENGSYIIEAMETGRSFYFNGNVQNGGCITNLPTDCCVEVPVYADRTGLHPVYVGDLPVVCAALNRSNIDVHRLARGAAISGDPEILVMACAIDPLTATKVTLREAREMVSEMLEKERVWLPQFEGKKVRKTPVISIPCDVKRVEVPMDPALAITARFKELAE